jgi:hypothetical protein
MFQKEKKAFAIGGRKNSLGGKGFFYFGINPEQPEESS